MKQKLKGYKGITLIALIITIIVLLILAVVAISAVKGDGIIAHAKNAKKAYSEAQTNEKSTMQGYLDRLEESQLKSIKIKDNLNKVLSTGGNITLEDDFGNKIKVPAGFKIITKTDTENTDLNYTAETIDVTKGIVAEDGEGNQFVWIPVGTIYTDIEKTEANAKTITLGRYSDFTKTNNAYTVAQNASDYGTQVKMSVFYSSNYTEDTTATHNPDYKNSIAKNIGEFCTKALASGGYYIGRYEARVENYDASNISKSNSGNSTDWTGYVAESGKKLKLASKANSQVWNYVTQNKASSLCQSMYTNKPFESDLVNSYAWDTAIVFIQEFENNTYSQTIGEAIDGKLSNKGSILKATKAVDKQCNIYDMAGNYMEWSTETYSEYSSSCTRRGGVDYDSHMYTSIRCGYHHNNATDVHSFRPVLYM